MVTFRGHPSGLSHLWLVTIDSRRVFTSEIGANGYEVGRSGWSRAVVESSDPKRSRVSAMSFSCDSDGFVELKGICGSPVGGLYLYGRAEQ